MILDFNQLKELLNEVSNSDITELNLEFKDTKLSLKKNVLFQDVPITQSRVNSGELTQVSKTTAAVLPPVTDQQAKVDSNNATNNNHIAITSPMVGTFYRAASPTAKPFVEIGDKVNPGQTICIIEAMKLMNDMPSEITGKIVKICVENGTTVEFGQNLFLVDPQG